MESSISDDGHVTWSRYARTSDSASFWVAHLEETKGKVCLLGLRSYPDSLMCPYEGASGLGSSRNRLGVPLRDAKASSLIMTGRLR